MLPSISKMHDYRNQHPHLVYAGSITQYYLNTITTEKQQE